MSLVGTLDTGRPLGGYNPLGGFHLVGTDNKRYIVYPRASMRVGDCDDGTVSATVIDDTRFNADLVTLSGDYGKTYTVSMVVPAKNTPYFLAIGNDNSGVSTQILVTGVWYRIDGPDTFTPLHKVGRRASDLIHCPDYSQGLGRGCSGASVINGKIYATIPCGTFFPDAMNTRFINGLTVNADDVDLTNSSWDTICVALPFAETLQAASVGGVDTLTYQHVSILQAKNGIGVFFVRSSLSVPFTKVATNGANTGETDIATDFGMPFSDWDKEFNGSTTINTSNEYLSPSIDGTWGEEVSFGRSSTGGTSDYFKFRLKRFSYNRFTDAITFLDESTFTYTASGFAHFDDRYGVSSRQGGEVNVAGVLLNDVFMMNSITLSAPVITSHRQTYNRVSRPVGSRSTFVAPPDAAYSGDYFGGFLDGYV